MPLGKPHRAALSTAGPAGAPAARPGAPGGLRPAALRVALVHDWLTGMRGGERVLAALCELFPHADLYTLLHAPGSVSPAIERRRIVASPLQRLPGAARARRWLLPLYPWAAGRLRPEGYDLVVSVSHAAAKAVRPGPPARHLCYLLTPMRYLWAGFPDHFGPGRAAPPVRMAARALRPALRRWDVRSARRVDRLVAVSGYVAGQARELYGREAPVVYPPVALSRFAPGGPREDFYLYVGALVPNKRPATAVAACRRLGRPLVVVGAGPEARRCRREAGAGTRFLGDVPDAEVAALYRRARAVLVPGREDFGLVPVEAMASGTPVIAWGAGGARETVTPGTGLLYDDPSPEGLAEAIRAFEAWDGFDPDAALARARAFGEVRFRREFLAQVAAVLDAPG